jgi:hypothetical protein
VSGYGKPESKPSQFVVGEVVEGGKQYLLGGALFVLVFCRDFVGQIVGERIGVTRSLTSSDFPGNGPTHSLRLSGQFIAPFEVEGGGVDAEGVGDFPDRFSFVERPPSEFALICIHLLWESEANATSPGVGAANSGALADEVSLEVRDSHIHNFHIRTARRTDPRPPLTSSRWFPRNLRICSSFHSAP